MAANHDKNHRKRQVIIMKRTLLATRAITRIRCFTCLQRNNNFALSGDDDHQHIGNHDRANGNPHLHKGTTRRENLAIAIGKHNKKGKAGQGKP